MTSRTALLLFDSARVASAVGLRSSLGADRTLIFRADGHTVDVMVQTSRRPPTYVHGQVVLDETGHPVVGASVGLDDEPDVVATDRHGEFAVSTGAPLGENVLHFDVPGGEFSCRIPAAPTPEVPA